METFSKQLLHVRREDVDLKFVFDHFRNYLICCALAFGSKELAISDRVIMVPYMSGVASYVLGFLAFFLFSLNWTHGLFAVKAISKAPRINETIYMVFTILLNLIFLQLLGIRFVGT